MVRTLVLAAALFALVTPLALAHDFNPNGNCSAVGDGTLTVEGIRLSADTPLGVLYVTDAPGVWSESNGVPGLQTHEHTCRDSPRDEPRVVGPDTNVL